MKYVKYVLLISILALAPVACSRNANQPASANSDNAANEAAAPARVDETAPRDASPREASPRNTAPVTPRRAEPAARPAVEDRPADRAVAPGAGPETRIPEARTVPRADRAMVTVPSGTALTVVLGEALGTDTSKEGDTFVATLAGPLTIDGRVVAERGTDVTGRVTRIDDPGKVKGRARMELELTSIKADKAYKLDTEPFIAVAPDSKDRDAAVIAGGAGVGAIIGGIAKGKKGAAIGAIIGGGSGTTAVLMTKGKDIHLDAETKVNFVLKDALSLPILRSVS
jgi:hypothetical protein